MSMIQQRKLDLSDSPVQPLDHNPEIVHLQITERCNLACPKCYVAELNQTPIAQELKAETLRTRLFEPATKCGATKLVITGGEPYLSRQIYNIVAEARPLFQEIFIGTTGYFFNEEHCHKTLDSEVNFIQISLDAVEPELHRRLTGIQNVERLWENSRRLIRIRNARQASTRVIAAIVIAQENVHEVLPVMKRCEAMGMDSITLQALHEYGTIYFKDRVDWPTSFPHFDQSFLDELKRIVEYVLIEKQNGNRLYPHSAVYYENLIRFFENRTELDVPCSSDDFIFVDSRGFIRGCLFSEPLGQIHDGIENYLRSIEFQRFRRFLPSCHLCTHGCAYRPPMD